jgi:hypothetical protein
MPGQHLRSSETVFQRSRWSAPASGHFFDMSVVLMPAEQALSGIGTTITSMETVGALMAARSELQ